MAVAWVVAGGVIVLVTLVSLVYPGDPFLELPLLALLGIVLVRLMAAAPKYKGRAILASLALLLSFSGALVWNLSALPGQGPQRFFSVHRGDYEGATAWLRSHPPAGPFSRQNYSDVGRYQFTASVVLPPAYQYLGDGQGAVSTWWAVERPTPEHASDLGVVVFSPKLDCLGSTVYYRASDVPPDVGSNSLAAEWTWRGPAGCFQFF